MQTKVCNRCSQEKVLGEFYTQEKHNKNGDRYTYYFPYCSECNKEKTREWRKENPDQYRYNERERARRPKKRKQMIIINRRLQKEGKVRDWQRRNKDKLRIYAARRMSKQHNITEVEWNHCKNYFNYECAYCGLNEKDHREIYKQQLHRDHAIHDGTNDLSNCIPACKSCNTSKGTNKLEEWYKKEDNFTQEKLDKIYEWLSSGYKKYIRKELINSQQ